MLFRSVERVGAASAGAGDHLQHAAVSVRGKERIPEHVEARVPERVLDAVLLDRDPGRQRRREAGTPVTAADRAAADAFAGEAVTVDPDDADEAWWNAFSHVVATRSLDIKPFEDMIEGQILDLEWDACRDRAELEQFCRLVASTVGDVCVSVWGHDGHEDVPALADARGLALQMTNVLRDLREDHERGRVYLPADELDAAATAFSKVLYEKSEAAGEGGEAPAGADAADADDDAIDADFEVKD